MSRISVLEPKDASDSLGGTRSTSSEQTRALAPAGMKIFTASELGYSAARGKEWTDVQVGLFLRTET